MRWLNTYAHYSRTAGEPLADLADRVLGGDIRAIWCMPLRVDSSSLHLEAGLRDADLVIVDDDIVAVFRERATYVEVDTWTPDVLLPVRAYERKAA